MKKWKFTELYGTLSPYQKSIFHALQTPNSYIQYNEGTKVVMAYIVNGKQVRTFRGDSVVKLFNLGLLVNMNERDYRLTTVEIG